MHSVRHAAVGPQWLRIPAELRERPQWAVSGADKAPLAIINGKLVNISVTSPGQWMTFEQACQVACDNRELPTAHVTSAGVRIEQVGLDVGFILNASDPLSCIDLDVKNDATHPDKPHLWTAPEDLDRHESIIAVANSYTERSRSGLGLHIWVLGKTGRGRKRGSVEIYSQERFIICTGDVHCDLPIHDRRDMLANMIAQMEPEVTPDAELRPDEEGDDMGCCVAARAVDDAGEMGRLMRGDWEGRHYPSQSEADFALLKMLGRLTESNGACREAFRYSPLGKRDKATDRYLNLTLRSVRAALSAESAQLEHGQRMAESLFWPEAIRPHDARHFRLLRDGDLDRLPRLRWLVKGIIPDTGIGAIYGDSGTFKSFLTLDALAHISNGQEWFGHRVRAAPAVYVPFEGQGGIPNRIRAWRLAQAAQRNPNILFATTPPEDVLSNVAVIVEPMNLQEQTDRDKLVATLTENGWAGGVLCIDTLAHASNGLDENSSAMGEMLAIFRDLQHRLGGVILVIHHSGKEKARGMRGWSGLHAAMDFVVECEHEKDAGHRDAQFVLTKVKDGASGDRVGFTMHAVQLGFDEDGDPITSLVVVPREDEADEQLPLKPDAERDNDDDEFVWEWVKRERERGEYPSGRSLEGQREKQMSQDRALTQKRLRDAIHRLRAASRLVDAEDKAPSGNVFMVAV